MGPISSMWTQDHQGGRRLLPVRPSTPQFKVLPDAQVERGDISSAGPAGIVRGGQSEISQASGASLSCWITAGGWTASGSLMMVDEDGGQQPQCYIG